jgi:calcineurin-like phosphoesterase family protein
MKIFTSDLHFGHKRIVEFTNRAVDCTSQENHTEWLIDVWNTEVSAGDIVYHLGDFSFFKKYSEVADVVSQLKGSKIFIKGNHDKREHLDELVEDQLIAAWYDYKEIKLGDTPVVLFHYPIASWHRQGHGAYHLHGHCHGNFKDSKGKMLDVGIDSVYNLYGKHGFLNEQQISEFMKEKEIYIADHHKEYK